MVLKLALLVGALAAVAVSAERPPEILRYCFDGEIAAAMILDAAVDNSEVKELNPFLRTQSGL